MYMYMYVCIYVYIYIHIHMYSTCVNTHTHIYICIYIYICIHIYICIYIYMCVYMYTYIHMHTYTYVCMCVLIHVYTYTKHTGTLLSTSVSFVYMLVYPIPDEVLLSVFAVKAAAVTETALGVRNTLSAGLWLICLSRLWLMYLLIRDLFSFVTHMILGVRKTLSSGVWRMYFLIRVSFSFMTHVPLGVRNTLSSRSWCINLVIRVSFSFVTHVPLTGSWPICLLICDSFSFVTHTSSRRHYSLPTQTPSMPTWDVRDSYVCSFVTRSHSWLIHLSVDMTRCLPRLHLCPHGRFVGHVSYHSKLILTRKSFSFVTHTSSRRHDSLPTQTPSMPTWEVRGSCVLSFETHPHS